jgi:hypothetical protein
MVTPFTYSMAILFGHGRRILLFYPGKESVFIQKHTTASPTDHLIESIGFFVKYQMSEPTNWRPSVMFVPLGDRDEFRLRCFHEFAPNKKDIKKTRGLCHRVFLPS